MAIQKQITKEEQQKKAAGPLGVSLNSLKKTSIGPVTTTSQSERNSLEISEYAYDIRKSLAVGAAVIVVELVLYYFKIVK